MISTLLKPLGWLSVYSTSSLQPVNYIKYFFGNITLDIKNKAWLM